MDMVSKNVYAKTSICSSSCALVSVLQNYTLNVVRWNYNASSWRYTTGPLKVLIKHVTTLNVIYHGIITREGCGVEWVAVKLKNDRLPDPDARVVRVSSCHYTVITATVSTAVSLSWKYTAIVDSRRRSASKVKTDADEKIRARL